MRLSAMRALFCAVAAGFALLAFGVARAETVKSCTWPPRTVRADLDAGGARYEWTSTCAGTRVVIRATYNDRTNRASEVVVFPGGATNAFDVWCARNPWAPGGRLPCTRLRTVVNVRSAFTEPWLGRAELRQLHGGRPVRIDTRAGAPTPLMPPSGAVLASPREAKVELRWTSGAGPAGHYRLELQRAISAQGPFSAVQDVEVSGSADLSIGYTVPPEVFATGTHHYWRWRVGQTADAATIRYSAWQTFSLR